MPILRQNPLALRAPIVTDQAARQPPQAPELHYDYSQVDEAKRSTIMGAAVEIKANAHRAKESLVRIGQKLAAVKALLPHGQFSEWCSVEFAMSQRMAQLLMNVAHTFADKSETVSLLSDSALLLLASPSVPEAARTAVIVQAQTTGKSPTKAQVQGVIQQHKQAQANTAQQPKIAEPQPPDRAPSIRPQAETHAQRPSRAPAPLPLGQSAQALPQAKDAQASLAAAALTVTLTADELHVLLAELAERLDQHQHPTDQATACPGPEAHAVHGPFAHARRAVLAALMEKLRSVALL